MRSGRQYVDALQDDRRVYLGGKRVPSVAAHPAFASAIQTIAGLYDMALDPSNDMQGYRLRRAFELLGETDPDAAVARVRRRRPSRSRRS